MSTVTYKPGDVALIRLDPQVDGRINRGEGWATAIRDNMGGWACGAAINREARDGYVLETRPLVVIDPADPKQIDSLITAYETAIGESTFSVMTKYMQAALTLLVTPRPVEPKGLGAVIKAVNGNHFVRVGTGDLPWQRASDVEGERLCRYEDIAVVEVVAGGVQ